MATMMCPTVLLIVNGVSMRNQYNKTSFFKFVSALKAIPQGSGFSVWISAFKKCLLYSSSHINKPKTLLRKIQFLK